MSVLTQSVSNEFSNMGFWPRGTLRSSARLPKTAFYRTIVTYRVLKTNFVDNHSAHVQIHSAHDKILTSHQTPDNEERGVLHTAN